MERNRMLRRPVWLVACALALLAPTWSCLDPTEIDLRITTNEPVASIAAPQQAQIFGGTPGGVLTAPTIDVASNTVDTSGSFGDLVIAPKGDISGGLALRVVLGVTVPTDQCDQSPQDCIVASRTISYVPHHELVLPVELDAACLGKTCSSGYTCVAGSCVDDSVDTSLCDGGTCGTGSLVDGSVPDAGPVVDAAPETSGCAVANPASCGTNRCVDLASDPANCGACGFDCTGGTCSGGTCQLTTLGASPKCVGVWNGSVYVVDNQNELYTVPANGGPAANVTPPGTTVYDVTTYPGTDLAYSTLNISTSLWSVDEMAQQKSGMAVIGGPDRVALDTKGVAWFNMSTGALGYTDFATPNTVGPPDYGNFSGGGQLSQAWLAVAAGGELLYLSVNQELCRGVSGNIPTCLGSSPKSLGVAVSDPSASNPDVYVVDGGTEILKYNATLATQGTTFASGGSNMAGLAWDKATSTAYAISDAAVYKSSNGSMTVLASAPNAGSQCIVVDATAVYWVEANPGGGVFKHAK